MASKRWIDYKKQFKQNLTDNVQVNKVLSPFYFILILSILYYKKNISLFGFSFFSLASFWLALFSTFIYIYASNYFQPDLDVHSRRPGMGHFPLGRWVGLFKWGRFFKWFFYPINRLWYYLWHPYGYLMTHRGLGHWPILGVWLRVGYLYFWLYLLTSTLSFIGLKGSYLQPIEWYLQAFFPWSSAFGNVSWWVVCFPVYMSDFFHWAVDYYDSTRKGISFCPPKIPRGLIAQAWMGFKDKKGSKR